MTARPTQDAYMATVSPATRLLNAVRATADRPGRIASPAPAKDTGDREAGPQGAKECHRDRTPKPATKAEAEWLAILRSESALRVIQPHPLTLIAPDGDRYTPDCGEYSPGCTTLYSLWEVKAGYRGPGAEQGEERFKRFRELYPWARLRLAEKKRTGAWYVDGKLYKEA